VKRDDSLWEVDTRGGQRVVVVTLAKATPAAWDFLLKSEVRRHTQALPQPSADALLPSARAQDVPPDTTPTHKVFFDVTIGDAPAERVVFGLYGAVAPRTAESFRQLCTGESGSTAAGVPRHFKGSKFHRIITGFMVQGMSVVRKRTHALAAQLALPPCRR
jgi:hypothetical protein